MGNELAIDLSQNEPNALTAIADVERGKLIPKNDYNKIGNEYSVVNKDAVADVFMERLRRLGNESG